MADKRITDVDFIDSLNSDESFFVNQNNAIKQINKGNVTFEIVNGGTGANNVEDARINLGLGSVATEDVLPVSKGGTGATDAAEVKANLGLGSVAEEDIVPIDKGGTNATTTLEARMNLGFTYGSTEPTHEPETGEGSVYFRTGGDAVVEIGVSGIWTYRKWASGIAECWGSQVINGVTCAYSWGTMYESDRYTLSNYPFTFAAIPAQLISIVTTSGSSYFLRNAYSDYGPTTEEAGQISFCRPSSSNDANDVTVAIYVIGRWK